MNGWDRNPSEYQPSIGWRGILALTVLVEIGLILAFGWLFV